jgi:hypothetical protein
MPIRQRLEVDAYGVVRQDAIRDFFGHRGQFLSSNGVRILSASEPQVVINSLKYEVFVGGSGRASGAWWHNQVLTSRELERVLPAVEEFNSVFDVEGVTFELSGHTLVSMKTPNRAVTASGDDIVFFNSSHSVVRDAIVTEVAGLEWAPTLMLNCIISVGMRVAKHGWINPVGSRPPPKSAIRMKKPVVLKLKRDAEAVYDEDTGKAMVVTNYGVSKLVNLDVVLKCATRGLWGEVYVGV